MDGWLARQDMLIGDAATKKLEGARVAVIGLGGVGGAALEAIARCGVGSIFVMDYDVFDASNINRQILAFTDTVGLAKADVAALRVRAINSKAEVTAANEKFCAETAYLLRSFAPDFVVDAVDMVTAKLEIIELCKKENIPVISCMGTGNRLDAGSFCIGDIAETANGCGCPLARVMRRELKNRGIEGVTVLYGTDIPEKTGGDAPASIAFVPPVAGYLIAGHVIRSLIKEL
jgi:Dinucleotide-utilizing enzymes involved in molybdopterin and thiamine biosynthesis family 1